MISIDVIILSYAKSIQFQQLTERAVESLLTSENPEKIKINVLIIESQSTLSPFQYKGTSTIYPRQKFNFNKFLNIGIKKTSSDYVCFANNDVIFKEEWASNIIHEMEKDTELLSASPICSLHHPIHNIEPNTYNYYGYEIRKEISGWCILVKRDIFKKIGLFDEKFKFWYADADYSKVLQSHNIKHALITTSVVDHLDGISTKQLSTKEKEAMTTGQYWYFQYKWEHKNYFLYLYRQFRSFLRTYFI